MMLKTQLDDSVAKADKILDQVEALAGDAGDDDEDPFGEPVNNSRTSMVSSNLDDYREVLM